MHLVHKMVIGLTYDLRDDYLEEGFSYEETAEFDRSDTIDGIEEALCASGHDIDRIGNIKGLVERLASGNRWDLVFNIAEGMYGFGRESQVPALLDAYRIPYTFSDPLVLSITLHKGITKSIIAGAGIPTADFVVVNRAEELATVNLAYPLFLKPVGEGTGKGISDASRVMSKEALLSVGAALLKQFRQPVLVERFLPGREFTVGIVGSGEDASALGAMEIIFRKDPCGDNIYSLYNKSHYEEHIEYRLPETEAAQSCCEIALKAWRILGCRDAGRIDLRMDNQGVPNVIEVNPLAGLNPVHSDLPILCRLQGISFQWLIKRIVDSAMRRVNHEW
ncbi:MAG: D-alanine--D-alanine ligase [Desulfomonilia bacterium]|nr:D-alanine--D-alanine ligase [Desulfomonilia bacterium]